MRPEVYVGAPHSLIERLSSDVLREADEAIAERGRFSIAIPGGSIVLALKTITLDWSRSHVFWVDERAVPPSSPDSNFGLARHAWLEPAGAGPSSIHRMPADDPDLDRAARAYSHELERVLGEAPRLDLVLLGVGPDGHVASLFPGHPALSERRQLVLPVFDSPKPPPRRLTLTMPMLTRTRRVIVMAMGPSKAAIIKGAIQQDDSRLPVTMVLKQVHRGLVLLDEDAARML